jgi:hypothetical protein
VQIEIGQIVLNRVTQEKGRIVRIATLENKVAYVVSLALDPRWGMTETETLWRNSEIKKCVRE